MPIPVVLDEHTVRTIRSRNGGELSIGGRVDWPLFWSDTWSQLWRHLRPDWRITAQLNLGEVEDSGAPPRYRTTAIADGLHVECTGDYGPDHMVPATIEICGAFGVISGGWGQEARVIATSATLVGVTRVAMDVGFVPSRWPGWSQRSPLAETARLTPLAALTDDVNHDANVAVFVLVDLDVVIP